MYTIVFVTASGQPEAEKIARHLLEKKLAACVNIIEPIKSMYWWEGKIDESQEALLVIKTKKTLFKKLASAVKSVHSYSVPEIIAMPIVDGQKDYLNWINSSVGAKS